jgi:hypothetical protein
LTAEAFWRNWLEDQLYYFLLIDSFRPEGTSIEALPSQLAQGRVGVQETLHRICLTSSFDRRNPGPDTFVSVVMEQLLGITVQKATRELEIGKALYDGKRGSFLSREGNSQADVVHNAVSDDRALRHFIAREYERWLRERPDDRELTAWAKALETDSSYFSHLVKLWFLSDAYQRRLLGKRRQPNRLFIRSLAVDLVDKVPSEVETQRLRSALDGLADSGPLRSLLARLMLDSGRTSIPEKASIADPSAWIEGLFEQLLGRPPNSSEARAFGHAFSDKDCRTTTIVYAIVSHPEYQTW